TEEGMGQIVQVCLGDLLISRCSHLGAIQIIPKLKLASLHKDCKVHCTQTTCGPQGVPCWLPHLRNAPVRVWECLLGGFPHLFYECGKVTWCGRRLSNRHMLRRRWRRDVIGY